MKGLIFNIQRYSIQDGSGIRTIVFLKGCPLHCPWCCNPESQSFQIEQVKIYDRCIHCKNCSNSEVECPADAITVFGKYMSVKEVLNEIEKDEIFYNTSGGGVTLSGGEVLSQIEFSKELLKEVKKLAINTAIETSGFGNSKSLIDLSKYIDLILFDLKIMDRKKAKKILGVDVELIKENMRLLVQYNKKVIPRIPLIPHFTMEEENIKEIITFVKKLGLREIHLLPFHQYGGKKYKYLNKQYGLSNLKPPTENQVNSIKEKIESEGFKVVIGGM